MNENSIYYKEYYDFVINEIEPSTKAKKAVFNIISDLTDRKGIGDEFDNIDGDIQDQIIDIWISEIETAMS